VAELKRCLTKDSDSDKRLAAVAAVKEVALKKDPKARRELLVELKVVAATDEDDDVREAAKKAVGEVEKALTTKRVR
jgi:hypothetical protein